MNSLKAKRLLGRLGRFARSSWPRRVVLLYHAVGSGPDACPEDGFAEQMAWLSRHTHVLPLDTLLEGSDTGQIQVAVTFDDGYASVAQVAAPIMARYELTATVYLTTACIADDETKRIDSDPTSGHLAGERFMLWSEARALYSAGWQIGSHGLDHVDMTAQSPTELHRQLQASRKLIEEHIAAPCIAFAYPWGRNDARTRQAATAAGYVHAAGTLHGPVLQETTRLAFRRIDIRRSYALSDLESILRGDWDYLGRLQAMRMRQSVGA